MKKKKSNEQLPTDFKNNPFKSLKGLTPRSAPAEKKAPLARRKEEKSEDDSALFFRAVSGVRKIEEDEFPNTDAAAKQKKAGSVPAAVDDDRLFLQAMKKIGTTIKDERPEDDKANEPQRRSPSNRMKQMKRGTIRIGGELDLHGFLRDEALTRLGHFIKSAFAGGQEAVLVITGKGLNSPEGPVLQGAVAAWLRERGKGMIAEFSPAPRDKGGSGAFVVFLKKK